MANPYAKRNRNNGPPGRFRNNNGGGGNNSSRNNNGGGGNNNGGGPRFGGYNNRSGGNNNRNNNNNNNRNNNRNNNNNRGGNGNNNNNNGGGGGPNADVMKTLLRLLFEKNPSLDPNTGMLDVSNMRGAPDLQAVSKTVDFNNVSFCKSLAEVLRDVYGNNIRLLMLSRNDIRKLTPFLSALMQVDIHQNITAIAAMDNAVNDLSFIAPLKQYPMLNEILLTGNPVCSTKEYRPQITRSLPNLTLLDGEPVFRPMLTMPNPVAPGRTPEEESMALQLAQFVDVNLLQPMMYGHAVEAIEQQISQAYAPEGMLSLSRAAEPLPRNVPFSATHNNADLDKSMKNAMQTDFASLKQGIRWRNLSSDVQSMREIARGQRDIVKKLKDYIGTNKPAISVQVAVNEYYNVATVEANMKVPVILVTVHGKIKYMWNPHPPNSAGASGIFQQGREPFISTFFDRTVSLIYRENRFFVVNDMIFCRPDRTVVHDNGTPSSELFFAGNPERVELMRRRLLPSGSFDVMNFIMFNSQNDATVQQYAARCANELSPEQQQSVDAVRGLLGI